MTKLEPVLEQIGKDFESALARYIEFLRIPSVSTDPAYKEQVTRAGAWLEKEFASLGFNAKLHETPGHPILLAHYQGASPGAPHLLYYGHYDVQPPEPLELWETPPFEPAIVDGPHGKRVIARGAVDDKGQVMTFLEAFRAWKAVHGSLPVNMTVLIEGEEESGSASLPGFLSEHAGLLRQADVAIVTDTNSWDIDTPAITYRLRGLVYAEVTLHGPSRDLHSGLYGGAVLNPINALTEILGQLHSPDGRIQIPGFYDDVAEAGASERQAWAELPFNQAAFLGEAGLTHSTGEAGYTLIERLWVRPTCDLNGIWGGYTGPGLKTVIPSRASAKLSFRTVPHQDPAKLLLGLKAFLDSRTPPDCRWSVQEFGASPGILVSDSSAFMQAARAGLEDIYSKPAAMAGVGGSIPVVGYFKTALGLDSILVGFGLDDDRIHSPNEKFELKCLKNGILSHAAILARMSAVATQGS
jgi:acetylornithine deacetylase/succinyl-diaminopimelate desuccinylase-like protein